MWTFKLPRKVARMTARQVKALMIKEEPGGLQMTLTRTAGGGVGGLEDKSFKGGRLMRKERKDVWT